MGKRNKASNPDTVAEVQRLADSYTEKQNMSQNEVGTAVVEAPETPTGAVGTVEKKGKNKGKVTPRDNGFKVIQTVNVAPENLVKSEYTGRAKPVSPEKVMELAESIRRFGQQQAVQVRPQATPGQFEIVFGHTRADAIALLRNGYTVDGKEIPPNPNVTVRAEVIDADDSTVMLHKVIENEFREGTNAIDKAKNQAILRDEFGMSDVAIAAQCNYASSATVSRLKKLLTLEQVYQDAVSDGTLTQNAAFLLADKVEPADRETVYQESLKLSDGEDSVGESAVKRAIVAHKAKVKEEKATQTADKPAGETSPTTAPEGEPTMPKTDGRKKDTLSLSVKDFKEILTEISGDAACPPNVATAMGMILSLLSGEMNKGDFAKWFAANVKE